MRRGADPSGGRFGASETDGDAPICSSCVLRCYFAVTVWSSYRGSGRQKKCSYDLPYSSSIFAEQVYTKHNAYFPA